MRSFIDKDGKVAWVFNEYTHPQGLHYKKTEPVAVESEEKDGVKEEPVKNFFKKKRQ